MISTTRYATFTKTQGGVSAERISELCKQQADKMFSRVTAPPKSGARLKVESAYPQSQRVTGEVPVIALLQGFTLTMTGLPDVKTLPGGLTAVHYLNVLLGQTYGAGMEAYTIWNHKDRCLDVYVRWSPS